MSFITVTVKRSADNKFYNVKMVSSEGKSQSCRRSARIHNFDVTMIEAFVLDKFSWEAIAEVRCTDEGIILLNAYEASIPDPKPVVEPEKTDYKGVHKGYDYLLFHDPSSDEYTFSVPEYLGEIECVRPSATQYGAKEAAIKAIDAYVDWLEQCESENLIESESTEELPSQALLTEINNFYRYQLDEALRMGVKFFGTVSGSVWANHLAQFTVEEISLWDIKKSNVCIWYAQEEWFIKTGDENTVVSIDTLLSSKVVLSPFMESYKDVLKDVLIDLLTAKFNQVSSLALSQTMYVCYAYEELNGSEERTQNNRWGKTSNGTVVYLPDAVRNDVRLWWFPSLDSAKYFLELTNKLGVPEFRKGDRVSIVDQESAFKNNTGVVTTVAAVKYSMPFQDKKEEKVNWKWKVIVYIDDLYGNVELHQPQYQLVLEKDVNTIIIENDNSGWVKSFKFRQKTLRASTIWGAIKEAYKAFQVFPNSKRVLGISTYEEISKYMISEAKKELGIS